MNIEVKSGVYTRNSKDVNEDVSFDFCTSLNAYTRLNFVDYVTSIIVDDDNYNYVIKDMVFNFSIIRFFTNIDTSEVVNADNIFNAIEEFLDETNIVEIVVMNSDPGVIEELREAVDLNIEYRTGIHTNPISSSLSNLLDTINKKFEDIDYDSMMKAAEAMSSISGELTAEKILDAYAKTDMFTKSLENVSTEKETVSVVKGGKGASASPLLSPTV